jgi:hypothetical protein
MAAELSAVESALNPNPDARAGAADHHGAQQRDNDIIGLMHTFCSRHCPHGPGGAAA